MGAGFQGGSRLPPLVCWSNCFGVGEAQEAPGVDLCRWTKHGAHSHEAHLSKTIITSDPPGGKWQPGHRHHTTTQRLLGPFKVTWPLPPQRSTPLSRSPAAADPSPPPGPSGPQDSAEGSGVGRPRRDNGPPLTGQKYVSPVAWDEQCGQCPPENPNQGVRP